MLRPFAIQTPRMSMRMDQQQAQQQSMTMEEKLEQFLRREEQAVPSMRYLSFLSREKVRTRLEELMNQESHTLFHRVRGASPEQKEAFVQLLSTRLLKRKYEELREVFEKPMKGFEHHNRVDSVLGGTFLSLFKDSNENPAIKNSNAWDLLGQHIGDETAQNVYANENLLTASKQVPLNKRLINVVKNELYNPHLLTPREALLLASREKFTSHLTFVHPFEDHEEGIMERLLDQTKSLMRRKTKTGRREKETMHGTVMFNPAGEAIATAIHRVSPLSASNDPVYKDDVDQFFTSSRGPGYTIKFNQDQQEMALRKAMLFGHNVRLFLVIGKAMGAARAALRESLVQLDDEVINAEEDVLFSTYYLQDLKMWLDNIPAHSNKLPAGQNLGSEGFLKRTCQYLGPVAYHTNTDPETFRRFTFADKQDRQPVERTLEIATGWSDVMTSAPAHYRALDLHAS